MFIWNCNSLISQNIVINTNDSGSGSLRSAVENLDSNNLIVFDIPGGGPHTILPLSPYVMNERGTIRNNRQGDEIIILDAAMINSHVVEIQKQITQIFGIKFINGNADFYIKMITQPGSTFQFSNMAVQDCQFESSSGGGIFIDQSSNSNPALVIQFCEFSNLEGNAIEIGEDANAYLLGNQFNCNGKNIQRNLSLSLPTITNVTQDSIFGNSNAIVDIYYNPNPNCADCSGGFRFQGAQPDINGNWQIATPSFAQEGYSFSCVSHDNFNTSEFSNCVPLISCSSLHPDYAPLMALYNSTNGDNWTNTVNNNLPWDQSCDPCDGSWYGIRCNSSDRVTDIGLDNNNLSGSIPDISGLSELRALFLPDNNLTGPIPLSIDNLQNLSSIQLHNNNLTGGIPEELGNLLLLQFIYLQDNPLGGKIPESLTQLSRLGELFLFNCNLSDSIPDFSNLDENDGSNSNWNLSIINLSNNNLTGPIPSNLNNLNNLSFFYLNNNNLSGCFPESSNSICNIGFNNSNQFQPGFDLSGNDLLPNFGDGTFFCSSNTLDQIGTPCNADNDTSTMEEIDDNCNCVTACDLSITPSTDFEEIDICSDDPIWVYEVDEVQGETYIWNYPDGATGDCLTPSCNQVVVDYSAYSGVQENTISVQAEKSCGLSEPLFIEFRYIASPMSVFTISNSTFCIGDTITAIAEENNVGLNYNWAIEDLGSVQGSNITFSFPTAGNYEIELRVENEGCSFGSESTDVTILGETFGSVKQEICSGATYTYRGETFDESNPSGEVILEGENFFGCDSLVSVDLTFISEVTVNMDQVLCEDGSIIVNGVTYDNNNPEGRELLQSINGCDSIINIELEFLLHSENNIIRELCMGEEIMINGTIYNEINNTGMEIITNSVGCDSIINVELNYLADSENNLVQDLCDGESIMVNGVLYDSNNPTGTETITGTNSVGCDSIVVIDLNILQPSETSLIQDICPGQSVTVGSTTYSEGNLSGEETLVNAVGCDSVITVVLRLVNFTTNEIFETICTESIIEVEGVIYGVDNPSGQEMTLNALGCDSIINIDLAFYTAENTEETVIICPGETYEREGTTLDFSNPIADFTYFDINGCDSIHTVTVEFDAAVSVDCVEGVTFVETTTEYIITPNDVATFDGIDENTEAISIYGRWGNKIIDIKNPNVGYTWDGRSEGGNMLPEGTYYFIIAQVQNKDSQPAIRRGFITLLN